MSKNLDDATTDELKALIALRENEALTCEALKFMRPSRRPEDYDDLAAEVAFSHAPEINECAHCRWPVADGYVCTSCGSRHPEGYPEWMTAEEWMADSKVYRS